MSDLMNTLVNKELPRMVATLSEQFSEQMEQLANRRLAVEALRAADESKRALGRHVSIIFPPPSDMLGDTSTWKMGDKRCACAVIADAIGFEYDMHSFNYDGLSEKLGFPVSKIYNLNDRERPTTEANQGMTREQRARWSYEDIGDILAEEWHL